MTPTDAQPTPPSDLDRFSRVERHVVLVSPEIHWNTGNVGRTCLGAGARLHLIEPLGFSLDDRYVKRAGLDYWPRVDVSVWQDFSRFQRALAPQTHEISLLTKQGAVPFWDIPVLPRMFLIFGSETKGLPPAILSAFPRSTYCIPMTPHIRSLNLSTAVGIVLYDTFRRR